METQKVNYNNDTILHDSNVKFKMESLMSFTVVGLTNYTMQQLVAQSKLQMIWIGLRLREYVYVINQIPGNITSWIC